MSQIPTSLPIFRQDTCDDGGFEEVNLNGDNECNTPVNEFVDFNKQFPMTVVQGAVRSRSLCMTLSSGFSSETEPSRMKESKALSRRWITSTEEDEEGGDMFKERVPGRSQAPENIFKKCNWERVRTPSLVDELLSEIYARFGDDSSSRSRSFGGSSSRSRASQSGSPDSDCWTEYSTTSENVNGRRHSIMITVPPTNSSLQRRDSQRRQKLKERGASELRHEVRRLETQIQYCMSQLTRQVKRRDRFRRRRERESNLITAILQASSQKRSQDTRIRFSLEPLPGDPGYAQWKDAMKMVARLPEGVPLEFRRKLWLNLSERYLTSRGVDWKKAERFCFNEWSNPDDDELGLQIVRDLHRTGCSLFCGDNAEDNQLMLKRVLLAYARWNKSIGYCQGFNMLAAIILEVMEKSEEDALKVMIYMIEGILPECYFTNNLRGLSVDMAVFRDLLKMRLPKLDLVLRVWDLILLEGNEVLLRTALAIWKGLEERILLVTTADEFYGAMGQLSQEMLDFSTEQSNTLVKDLVEISPFPFSEIGELRENYTYNITPWSQGIAVAKKGLKILYSDDEDNMDEDEEKIAVAATFGISAVFKSPKSPGREPHSKNALTNVGPNKGPSGLNVDRERLTVDISALKQQYSKLRQRQKQAQIILSSAMTKHLPTEGGSVPPTGSNVNTSVAMNHLLLGKKPLVTTKPRRGPIPGSVPAPKAKPIGHTHGPSSKCQTTQVLCPQPEIVVPNGYQLSTTTRRKKGSSHHSLFSPESKGSEDKLEENQEIDAPKAKTEEVTRFKRPGSRISRSSSTEHFIGASDDETENATDLEELPRDLEHLDSASLKSDCDNRQFAEALMKDFDRAIHGIDEIDEYEPVIVNSANSEKAIQIIKENSEILEKILRKKGEKNVPSLEKSLTTEGSMDLIDKGSRRSSMMSRSVSSGGQRRGSNPSGPVMGSIKPITFNPFPKPVTMRRNKEVGRKLGLYSTVK
ncbi:hypothetical protein TCAL_01264 [Tigriopus californicus]|uniref:Rab-GAP TBC domain-containing protein n=1 Tax=Tigriopus californicus TaxID=6832 RepID=A0A553PB94_TIGCA|nr:hypothetical protein TCAL_01264 [Tigriopus californicus]|eukprot:TCALIF_01264-PA protein Name:"Similar to TBC1D30 TBC1 domain family member 30 (Homo sapiens)" AED:0.02 eAED:0.02 QI:91/0.91/0.84/1/0.83/1/13/120/977